ncbi:hypothetical protein Vretimale_5996 [Volvox reticuliferus]|nr:hypothetical protein Vretifemale_6156 [Volvox reticuliferus]GIM01174.1 hypothetical protein Vretimale_5996 [Volvox reticuliferus]
MAVKAISVLIMTPVAPTHGSDGIDSSVAAGGGAWEVPRIAVFTFEDVVRPGVREAVAALQDGSWRRRSRMKGAADTSGGSPTSESGSALRVVMLTGDNPAVAASVAGGLSISDYRAAMLPQDKLRFVQEEQQRLQSGGAGGWWNAILGNKEVSGGSSGAVLMMGDGINDAPALAAAHVGVAVANSPRDLVAAASDVIVLNGQGAAALPWLLRMAHRTQSVVHQNLTLALASMAFATLPTVAGFFPLWLAVLLHEGSTLAVALNSLRLLLPEVAAASGDRGDAAAGVAAAAGALGPRAVLAEVWRGLCDLAAPEPHGHHHHDHHHHHHDHDHHDHHDHHRGNAMAEVRICCGAGKPHSHVDAHQDHHHDDQHHVNSHNLKPVEEVAELPQVQSQQQLMPDTQPAKANSGMRDMTRVRGSVGRDVSVSSAAWILHARGQARHGAASTCCGGWHGGAHLGPLLGADEGGGLGAGSVHLARAVRRRRHVASRVGSGVGVGIVAAATTAASAATAAAATLLAPE